MKNYSKKIHKSLCVEYCDYDVGLESGSLPDSALSASSSYDPVNVGPLHARLGHDEGGGAWCPQHPVGPDQGPDKEYTREWLGVNMTQLHVIRSIMTQGRSELTILEDTRNNPNHCQIRSRSGPRVHHGFPGGILERRNAEI